MYCQIHWPIFVAAEMKLNMHHCSNIDSIDIARGIKSVAYLEETFFLQEKIIYITILNLSVLLSSLCPPCFFPFPHYYSSQVLLRLGSLS